MGGTLTALLDQGSFLPGPVPLARGGVARRSHLQLFSGSGAWVVAAGPLIAFAAAAGPPDPIGATDAVDMCPDTNRVYDSFMAGRGYPPPLCIDLTHTPSACAILAGSADLVTTVQPVEQPAWPR